MLISFAVTVKLMCVFVFSYAKRRFSHEAQLRADAAPSEKMHPSIKARKQHVKPRIVADHPWYLNIGCLDYLYFLFKFLDN